MLTSHKSVTAVEQVDADGVSDVSFIRTTAEQNNALLRGVIGDMVTVPSLDSLLIEERL